MPFERQMMDMDSGKHSSFRGWRRMQKPYSCFCDLLCMVMMILTVPVHCSYQPKEMFLNSYAQCGHGDSKDPWYKVDKFSLYNIRDDASPDTGTHAFRNCEMVFRSTRSDGHLCMRQRSIFFESHAVELKLYDGSTANKTLNIDHSLTSVEWCTTGRMLTIEMLQAGKRPSVREVDIDLMVYDMQSVHRKAYMDSNPSCGSTFEMDGSQVNVTNLDISRKVEDLFPKCSLTFEYKGHEKNRTMCMVFEAHRDLDPGCQVNYTLEVYEYRRNEVTGATEKVLSNTRTCSKPLPWRWCYNSTKISLELHRPSESIAAEDFLAFHALVLDHAGGPETLPLVFDRSEDVSAERVEILVPIAVGCAVAVIVVIVTVCVVLRLRQRSGKQKSELDNGADETMLGGSDGHTKTNGQNHYTDGTSGTAPAFV